MKQTASLALLVVATLAALVLIPLDSWRTFFDPCHVAAISALATTGTLLYTRNRGPRAMVFERRVMAAFLAGMPLVYVATLLFSGEKSGLAIELAAVPIYGTMAWLGLKRWPMLIAIGIGLHGVAWDAWHLAGRVVPPWYAAGCLILDVAMAIYVAVRVSNLDRYAFGVTPSTR
jgi:hypothetical protein